MATLSDVALLAGVSISAVSRVLSDAPSARVGADTRARIRAAAVELDYRPNFAARALKFSRTNVIALVVPDLTNAIFTDMMRGVEEEAIERGYMVLLARAEGMRAGGDSIKRLIGEGRVDGVLVQVGDNVSAEDLAALLAGKVPAVIINSAQKGHIGSVALPDSAAAEIAVQHLAGLGHRRIAFLNGSPRNYTAVHRLAGFEASMKRAGLRVDPALLTTLGYQPRQGREGLRHVLEAPSPPSAIVVANVNAAIGALSEARALGIRVPEDLSIVAIHDSWTAENTWPPLTTVRMPLYELGRQAMAAISDRLSAGTVKDVIVSEPPVLIVRESTGAPRAR
ncbi:LacI family DNA-binding transcriptional regulator [Glaciihabitans sp. UYNi722]|uniref:LacI family DNA-binding transcriptional regulator n=1 Tax=Glaciihabitans sp. UYNi722 TaxID=3156344 RepID=UPI0033930456